jgi:hypothetical protein
MTPEDVPPRGYDEEERYFHERERETLEKLKQKRAELDAARKETQTQVGKGPHWMKCPKCGSDLKEIEMDRILVDKCTGCEGIFFDKGELELMLEAHKGSLASRLRKLF